MEPTEVVTPTQPLQEPKIGDLPLWMSHDQAQRLGIKLRCEGAEVVHIDIEPYSNSHPNDTLSVIVAYKGERPKFRAVDGQGLATIVSQFKTWKSRHE